MTRRPCLKKEKEFIFNILTLEEYDVRDFCGCILFLLPNLSAPMASLLSVPC